MARVGSRTHEVLIAIQELTKERGYPPTIREMMKRTRISSSSVVAYHLDKLAASGHITWQRGKPRTIVIVKPVWYS